MADLESNRESVSKQQEEYFESNIKEYQEKIKVCFVLHNYLWLFKSLLCDMNAFLPVSLLLEHLFLCLYVEFLFWGFADILVSC